ncbi:hypothetical protein L1887_08315 [Cichorium endivia]|nr:hypothetical protein L1887_08315 [Cichorium endivia]
MAYGVQFYSYSSFCFLVTIMGLVISWSFTLALLDGYSVLVTCPVRQKGILVIIVIGDWMLSTLTLGVASSGTGLRLSLVRSGRFIRRFKKKHCKPSKFQYDPASYSLNFNGGQGHTKDDELYFRDLLLRYASVSISTKSSMDLGKDELTFYV